MDSQDVPGSPAKQSKAPDGTGLVGRPRGRPRKEPRPEAKGSNAGNVEGFTVPARPEVNQESHDKRTFTVIPFRAISADITHGAFRTLAQIASYSNKNGFTWVGLQRLANEKGVTIQAISKHVQELKEAGLIEETAKAYWGGATPRTSTMRIIFDPSMTDEDVLSRAGSQEQVEPILGDVLVDSTSLKDEVVNSRQPTKADLERLRPSLIAEVLARYRTEGLPDPGRDRLEREVAELASIKARSGTLLA